MTLNLKGLFAIKTLLFGVFLIWVSVSHAQVFPSYQKIQNAFLKDYKAGLVNNSSRIIFEKRPAGWFVRQVEFFPKAHTIRFEMFWSNEDKSFRKLNFDKQKSGGNNIHSEVEMDIDSLYSPYDFFPYYGYRNWERDVLNMPGSSTLSTLTIFQHALCFASLANTTLVEDAFAYDTGGTVPFADEKRREQLFKDNIEHALTNLKRVQTYAPNFEYDGIPVEDHYRLLLIKRALFLSIYFNQTNSVESLADDLYTPAELSYFYNVLISCPENTLLFVSGEVDVFPLYYIILNQHFRKDVILINREWLDQSAYQTYLSNIYVDTTLFGVASKDIVKKQIDFVRVLKFNRIRQKQLPGQNLATQKVRLEGIADNSYQTEDFDLAQEHSELKYLLQFVTQDFDNQMDNGLTRYNYFPTNGILLSTDSSYLQWKLDANILSRNDLIFLDLMVQHIRKRPVCFVSSMPIKMRLSMDDYRLRGLVYEVVDNKNAEGSFVDDELINADILLANLMYNFRWGDGKYFPRFEFQTYAALFNIQMKDLAKREKFNGAFILLENFFTVFGKETWHDAKTPAWLAEYYYVFNKMDKGDQLMQQIANKLMAKEFPMASVEEYQQWTDLVESILRKYKRDVDLFRSE